ncbi:MAG: aminodeoxychorismate synthase component I [Elusimicrobia bacterium]|nr:aminodeoxychorismate synthase component I [Candidatus Obscuribacterium magneticum]
MNPPGKDEVILHDALHQQWMCFRNPWAVLTAYQLKDVWPVLEEVERRVKKDKIFAAGCINYEAAPAFDRALAAHPAKDLPLVWFGLYPAVSTIPLPSSDVSFDLPSSWTTSINQEAYHKAISHIKILIARGDCYQVNYTFRLKSILRHDPWFLFTYLAAAQKAPYSAFLNTGETAILSFSPELFFALKGTELTSRPMKGTAPRGRTLEEDLQLARSLRHSRKNQAENLMIVDMMRNDLGKVATTGSIHVPHLFTIEKYPTVWQMTSTVQAQTKAGFSRVLEALFPAASITGAPKPRATHIIAGLETAPRGIYTGAIGFLAPDQQAQFNVAIRTLSINRKTGQAEYGVGGGIVWDSKAEAEYEECKTKAKILVQAQAEFALLETMRWTPREGYFLLRLHLKRLERSAKYFDYPFDTKAIDHKLRAFALALPRQPHKVRLLLYSDGHTQIHAEIFNPSSLPPFKKVTLAKRPVMSADPFLYHKTTSRKIYDEARKEAPEGDDVLLWNERGEITESCHANVAIERDGQMFTPPVPCGLLPGTFRAHLLRSKRIKERVIILKDLKKGTPVYLMNSVRGLWRVDLSRPEFHQRRETFERNLLLYN